MGAGSPTVVTYIDRLSTPPPPPGEGVCNKLKSDVGSGQGGVKRSIEGEIKDQVGPDRRGGVGGMGG